MCFAPEADAIVGAVVVAVGIDALRHVREPAQIPLASLPLLFGLHQLSEAVVWWSLQGHGADWIGRAGIWVYVVFALVFLPAFVPVAVGLVEDRADRRRLIAGFGALGLVVAVALGIGAFGSPIDAAIHGWHIEYAIQLTTHGGQWTALYVVATCGALLASSHRDLERLGALNLVVTPVLVWMTVNGFVSLWCFWAAIASMFMALHLHRRAALLPVGRTGRADIRPLPAE